ncbi:methyltransferase domain-containing protein [Thalassobaculum sp. OXR-137]|uniref:class I SAM-dependent methyltransferase n=1 Tax=Thalassobaculum sp. OXR-137 TaxID=3100173 RepID=UPI002AC9CEB4|nr:methyltransferase domain-containing protein [Thalassobaculum sp. OXR-137]WPZ33414.1 methyltransferase domain-containing protein [Thalassobaculum sp. OXR-137]
MSTETTPSPSIDDAIADYDRLAGTLAPRYAGSGAAERLVKRHAAILPKPPGPVLDIGAGSGAHAVAFEAAGYRVVAVEPSAGMRAQALTLFPDMDAEWIDDRLPDLAVVRARGERFAFILINAVWMHVPPADRGTAVAAVADLLTPGGIVSLALRQGPPPADRPMYEVLPEPISADFRAAGFEELERSEHGGGGGSDAGFVRLVLRKP